MKTPDQVQAVGIPWYELEDYANVKSVMEDGDRLPQVYSIWRMKAEQTERHLRRQGHLVVRAHLKAADFVAWCSTRGLNVNSHARSQFASWVALQQYRASH
jgi:hypothetical protein